MNNFALSGNELFYILDKKGVKYLHHANTVATSITFIEHGALLSRNYIESNNLFQTPQKSDIEDKKYDVWDSVFLDGEDLHVRYERANKYGPVLFRFNLNMLLHPEIQKIHVTRINPWYWNDMMSLDSKYYSTTEDIDKEYLTGSKLDSQVMFTIKNPNKKIVLHDFLHSIGIDMPQLQIPNKGNLENLGDYTYSAIKESLDYNGLQVPILRRNCTNKIQCKCYNEYRFLHSQNIPELKKRFSKIRIM